MSPSKLYLVDGTFELFRAYYSKQPMFYDPAGRNRKAVVGLVASLIKLLRDNDVDHVAVAFDNPITCFRNKLFEGYKDGLQLDPEVKEQFDPAEEAIRAMGIPVWNDPDYEADDMIASGVYQFHRHFEEVVICTPDKDLSQCLLHPNIIQYDVIRGTRINRFDFIKKWEFIPELLPDYQALVGEPHDGIPGLRGFGAKTVTEIIKRWGNLENIPQYADDWVGFRGAKKLAATWREQQDQAALYRELALLRNHIPLKKPDPFQGVPKESFLTWVAKIGATRLRDRPHCWVV